MLSSPLQVQCSQWLLIFEAAFCFNLHNFFTSLEISNLLHVVNACVYNCWWTRYFLKLN